MRGKTAGTRAEHKVRDYFQERDWIVIHTRPGTNFCDIVAHKAGYTPMFIEVKSTAGGPYERFGPKDRQDLFQAAEWAGAMAVLAWWPPRGKLRLIYSDEWPTTPAFACVIDESAGLAPP